jgi:Spy/CpxP family protein refolding chaperone
MKKVFLGILLTAFVAVGALAQDQDPGLHKKHRGGPQDVMQQLNLTDEQKTELKAIREDYKEQMADLKKNEDITVREWKSRMETIRKDHRDKVQHLLTDDQKASMKKMMEDHKGDRKKHFFGHHAGRKGHHGHRLEKMKKELGLTDDQVATLKKNREETMQKLKALREDKSKTEEQKKAEVKEFKKQQHESLKSILTEEQLQKLQQQKKSHRPAPVQS